jgi:hypothetical protein
MTTLKMKIEAYEAGEKWARELKKGMKFDGARPEAVTRYPYDPQSQSKFVAGALDIFALPGFKIVTNAEGILLRNADGSK